MKINNLEDYAIYLQLLNEQCNKKRDISGASARAVKSMFYEYFGDKEQLDEVVYRFLCTHLIEPLEQGYFELTIDHRSVLLKTSSFEWHVFWNEQEPTFHVGQLESHEIAIPHESKWPAKVITNPTMVLVASLPESLTSKVNAALNELIKPFIKLCLYNEVESVEPLDAGLATVLRDYLPLKNAGGASETVLIKVRIWHRNKVLAVVSKVIGTKGRALNKVQEEALREVAQGLVTQLENFSFNNEFLKHQDSDYKFDVQQTEKLTAIESSVLEGLGYLDS